MIAPDFSLDFAGFFPREKSGISREKFGTSRKNLVKNTGFFPRKTAPKLYCSIFLCTFLCRNTHVFPPPPPARPGSGPIMIPVQPNISAVFFSRKCGVSAGRIWCQAYCMWSQKCSSRMWRLWAMLEYRGFWHFCSKAGSDAGAKA